MRFTIFNPSLRTLLTIGCLALVPTGCGKNDGQFEIHGQVSFESQPIADGKLLFMPMDESQPQAIAKIVDGEYTTASPGGVFAGKYKVQVFGYRKTGKVQDLGPLHGEEEQQEQYIPARFNRETEITVEISAAETIYNIEL